MRRGAWLLVPAVAVIALWLVVFDVRGPTPTTAFTLRPGDCFDIPADSQVGDIATLDCASPHDAEVFLAGALPDPSASPSAGPPVYPGDAAVGEWVAANCDDSAQRSFLGAHARVDLAVGYFYPGVDAWTRGERRVTCYLHTIDGSRLTSPLEGAAPS